MIELIEQPSTELTVHDRAAIALASDKTRKDLIAMSTKYMAITEIKNKAGRDECHSAAMTLASARIAISKTGKAARDDATKFSKAIIAEEASLIAITEPEEKRLLALRDSWDAVIAAEKASREAAEKDRVMAITERIAGIRQYVELAASCRTAARIHELLENLARISMDGFEEFADEATTDHADAMKRVESLLVEKHIKEQEQEKIKAEQAAQAAAMKAEREAFAAQQALAKAEIEQAKAVLQAAMDKRDAELAAARAAHEAEVQRATQASREAAAAEAARVAAERQRLDDERKAFEDQVREANRVAAQAEDDRLDALASKAWEDAGFIPIEVATTDPETFNATSCCAPDGICTDACSNKTEPTEPSDGDLIWTAQAAIAAEYGMTTQQAFNRLKAIDWTI